MELIPVDDPADPRLVELRGLRDAQARAITEAEHGCFIAEGVITLDAVLDSPYRLRSVLVDAGKVHRLPAALHDVDVPVYVAPPEVLHGVTGFSVHRGVLGSVARTALPDPAGLIADAARDGRDLLVLEGVNNHENLGAIFRNAAALGVGAVLLDPTTADPLYRRSVRVSLGQVLRVPWTRIGDLPDSLDDLHDAGWTTVALSPAGEVDIASMSAGAPGPTAWLLGAEGPGLTAPTMTAASVRARIPVEDGVDSLNVATAAAVALGIARALRPRV